MKNWKDDLDKIKLPGKENQNGQEAGGALSSDRVNSGRSDNSTSVHKDASSTDNSVSGGSRSIFRGEKIKPINSDERRNKIMIPAKGVFDDLNKIKEGASPDVVKVVEALEKLAKIILNTRTNTVKIMDKLCIPRDEVKKEQPK
jgi:hypothetical protein